MFEYSQADIGAQVAALPFAFQIWFQWMFYVIVLAPILFIYYRQGRVALAFSVVFLAVQFPLMRTIGLTNLLSLSHLLIWGPLVVYLCRELRMGRIARKSIFGAWSILAVATAVISLVFDVRDFSRWVAGERAIVSVPAEATVPWLWLALIIFSLLMSGWYIFGKVQHSNNSQVN